jgi:predicted Rossmann-fold nucleotide-binding protein
MNHEIVEAINDLTRVTIALSGGFGTRSEAIRRLAEFSIPSSRIAAILAMPSKDVRSVLAQSRKRKTSRKA